MRIRPFQLWRIAVLLSLCFAVRNAAAAAAPSITAQPQSQTSFFGSNVVFTVGVSGQTPLFYQWSFNGINLADNGHVIGSTTANLTINNITTNDAGNYQLVVTNSHGSATSSNATLVVLVPAMITVQPTNQSVVLSNNVSFSAAATGDAPLAYQWYFNGSALTDGGRISGSATPNLSIANAQANDAGPYQLVVTNDYGLATSAVATLTVVIPVAIVSQPSSQSVLLSSNASFVATASGTAPLSYQWYFNGAPVSDGGRVSGAATTNLNLSGVQAVDAGSYELVVANAAGVATSAVARLTVLIPAAIVAQPTNHTVLPGATVIFSASVAGTLPMHATWYSNGTAMAGEVYDGLTEIIVSNVQTNQSGTLYQVVVTNNYGKATSAVASLTVLAPVQITSQPGSQDVLLGSNVTFAITAAGSGPLSYQWYFNGAALADGGRISGSSTPALNVANVQGSDAGSYLAVVTGPLNSATSWPASLTPQTALAPSTRYVASTSTNPTSPYLDWSTAATNIQDAVDAAVAGDTVLVADGIYAAGGHTVNGFALTNRVAVTKPMTLLSVNGPLTTVIQGNTPVGTNAVRCIYATNGVVVNGFTLTNGATLASGDYYNEQTGGGIKCEPQNVLLTNCIITGNQAENWGTGTAYGTILNCTINGNRIQLDGGQGGGVFSGSVTNCVITGNYASEGGGAVYSTLAGCNVSRNSSAYGGAAANSSLTNCQVIQNEAFDYGGATYNGYLENCVVISNSANVGGAAYVGSFKNCFVANNRAFSSGGAVYDVGVANCTLISNSAATDGGAEFGSGLSNCKLVGNQAFEGGGDYGGNLVNCTLSGNSANAGGGTYSGTLKNCIVYDNTGTNGPGNWSGSFLTNCCTMPLPPGSGNITNDPAFVDLANGDLHLQSTSPCINSGNNAFISPTSDLDGNPRIVGGTVDMGAYEYQNPTSVISYAWLEQYGLPLDGSADFADTDSTGMNNWQKWIAGLNPLDPTSIFAMQTPQTSISPAGITVSWLSVSNRTYYLQQATNLSVQPAFSTIQSNIVGQAGTTSFTDATATNGGPYFYRVGVQ